MPHRRSWLAIVVVVATSLYATAPARAVPFDNRPKLLLHLKATTAKNACNAGLLSDCTTAVTSGALATPGSGPFYFAYVLAARGNIAGLGGVQFGIDYQDSQLGNAGDGVGLDIFQWKNCATLEFSSTLRPWPEPGASSLITWDAVTNCQVGETAVVGYFYVGAYEADELRLIPRPVDDAAKVADCQAHETRLESYDLGRIAFGGMGTGCNPCIEACGSLTPPPDTSPPGAITLAVGTVTHNSVVLNWLAPDEDGPTGFGRACESYDMRRSTSPITDANFNLATIVSGMPIPLGATSPQAKTITGLTGNTTYYFAIKAFDDAQNAGPLSNVPQVTTLPPPDATAPAAVTNLAITDVTSSSFRLTWTAPGDDGNTGQAASYDVRYSVTPMTSSTYAGASQATGEPAPSPAGSPESFVLSGLAQGTRYYVALRTLDERPNTSALSNVVNAFTVSTGPPDTTPPAAILDLVVTGTTTNQVTLEWTVPGDDSLSGQAAQYDLRRSTSPITEANFVSATQVPGEPVPLASGQRQGMTVGGLLTGSRYYFAIKTGDDVPNWSPLSNVVEQRTNRVVGNAKLMLHVRVPTTKSACTQGQLADCRDAVTKGDLATVGGSGPYYFVYLLGIEFAELGGLQCGITYDAGRSDGDANHEAIDIFSWTLCASVEFASSGWPKPGSGNLITWDGVAQCQTAATAVAGYFYMAAYAADILQLIPRPSDGLAKMANCSGVETVLPTNYLGTARFTAGAVANGISPCGAAPGVNVLPTTWSQIKTLVGQ